MSKEEIVREQYEKMFGTQKYDTSVNRKMNFQYFSPAMDQYAKQECIAFLEWKYNREKQGFKYTGQKEKWDSLSPAELYASYVSSKNT